MLTTKTSLKLTWFLKWQKKKGLNLKLFQDGSLVCPYLRFQSAPFFLQIVKRQMWKQVDEFYVLNALQHFSFTDTLVYQLVQQELWMQLFLLQISML